MTIIFINPILSAEFPTRMYEWLRSEPGGIQAFILALRSAFIYIIIATISLTLLEMSGVTFAPGPGRLNIAHWTFPFYLFYLAFIEECMFRAPLSFIARFFGVGYILFAVAIALSVIFGFAHGNFTNILIQGWGGIIWSIVYVKCGGAKGKLWKPLLTASFGHFFSNGIVALSALMHGSWKL